MRDDPPASRCPARERARGARRSARHSAVRILPAFGLVASCALLSACSSSSRGLIPASDAGPLQSDFEAVAQAAQNGNGDCAETAGEIRKTEQDFAALPTSVASNLRNTLSIGISNLSTRALARCAQTTSRSTTTTTTTTAIVIATTTETTTETTTSSTSTTTGAGGGTPAPGEPAPGAGGSVPSAGSGGAGGVGVGSEGQK
jgi:hypothetical protein